MERKSYWKGTAWERPVGEEVNTNTRTLEQKKKIAVENQPTFHLDAET